MPRLEQKDRARLSIVLILRDPKDKAGPVLNALSQEPGIGNCEILLIDGRPGAENAAPDVGGLCDGVLTVLREPGASMPRLKAIGARQCSGDAVAFLEPKGVPATGWLEQARAGLRAHPGSMLSGSVGFDGPPTAANHAAFVFEYGVFTRQGLRDGKVADLSGNNMILPLAALLSECGDILDSAGLNKPFCQMRLSRAGLSIHMQPEMRVVMRTRHLAWPLLCSRFHYARCFGGTRIRETAARRRRWMYRVGAPVVPFLLIRRHLRTLRQSDLAKSGPGTVALLVALCISWALGEAVGSYLGPGRSCDRLY